MTQVWPAFTVWDDRSLPHEVRRGSENGVSELAVVGSFLLG
jgi:hypothetical protein